MNDATANRLFRLSTGVFFMGGLVASLLSLLVPKLRLSLSLDYAAATTVQLASHSSYLILALPIASIISRCGYMRGHATGLALIALGLGGIVAGFAMNSYPFSLGSLCAVSAGATFLQIASNTAVTMVGDPARAAMRLTILQGLNSAGTVLGPLLGATFVLSDAPSLGRVPSLAVPFGIAAVVLALLAARFWSNRDLLAEAPSANASMVAADWTRTLRRPRLVMGAAAIFAYVGAEVTIGALLIDYLMLPRMLAVDAVTAGRLVSLYWGGAMIGRFAGGWLLRRVAPQTLLLSAAIGAASLATIAVTESGPGAAIALIGVGLFNSVMYPTIYVLALPRTPAEATAGATVLCMAVVGGAIVPVLTGLAADRVGLAHGLVVPVGCYLAVILFARSANDREAGPVDAGDEECSKH